MNYENQPQHSAEIAPDNAKETALETSDGKGIRCMNKNDVTVSVKEAPLMAPDDPEVGKVDVISLSRFDETMLAESDDPDATEHSSSFGDTISDSERCSGLSEAEVESQFFGDSDLASYDAFNSLFHMRKKKLTSHWRNFIHPLKWRCKWVELKIKEIESRSLKYERELAACKLRRHPEVHQSSLECFASKALPFLSQSQNRMARKRRKRKRVEDTADIKSYFAHHNLFSHLENKKTNRDGALLADEFGGTATMDQHADGVDKLGITTDELLLEFGHGDSSFEQTLWKIEMVHSRVQKLKRQIEMVMSKNAAKFSSSENLSLLAPYDAQTSSAPSPTVSASNGDIMSMGAIHGAAQLISDDGVGHLIPEGAISIYDEAVHIPDIIESTAGLLSATDVTLLHQPQIGDSSEYIFDNVLIHNEAVEEERLTFTKGKNQATEGQCKRLKCEEEMGGEEESTNPSLALTSEDKPLAKTSLCPEEATMNSCLASDFNFPRNKRKRGERKSGSGGWNRKGSGEPDSQ